MTTRHVEYKSFLMSPFEITPANVCLALSGALLLYFAAKAAYNNFLHPLASVPCPSPWAATSTMWAYYHLLVTRQRFHILDELFRRTDAGVVRDGPNKVIVCDPEVAKRVMTAKWSKNHDVEAFSSDHTIGTAKRKIILPLFSNTSLQGFEEAIVKHVGLVIGDETSVAYEKVDETATYLNTLSGQAVETLEFFAHVLVDIMGEVLLDDDIGCLEAYARGSTHPVVQAVGVWALRGIIAQLLPSWVYSLVARIPNKFWQVVIQADRTIVNVAEPRTLAALDRGASPDRLTLVHRLGAADESNSDTGTWSMDQIISETVAQLFAGMSTSSTSITYCLWALSRHPAVLQKLQSELDAMHLDMDGALSFSAVTGLPYLNGVIRETLRLYPPVNTASFRLVDKAGMMVGTHHIPAGVQVGVQTWTMHRLESIWGEDAAEFRPERWLKPQTHLQNIAWQPFSIGARSCPGMNLALIDIRLIVAAIVHQFDVSCAPQTTDASMRPIDRGAIEPASGVCWLRFTARQSR